jgi:hypothetical protein
LFYRSFDVGRLGGTHRLNGNPFATAYDSIANLYFFGLLHKLSFLKKGNPFCPKKQTALFCAVCSPIVML